MSEGAALKQLSKWVEPRRLVQIGGEFRGALASEQLPRLSEVCEGINEVYADIRFHVDDHGKRLVEGQLKAEVLLQCQRCMENVSSRLESNFSLILAWDEQEASSLPKDVDAWIVGDGEHDLHELVEDELLLCLPAVAYHDYDCVDKALYSCGSLTDDEQEEDKPNPFGVLEQLKKR